MPTVRREVSDRTIFGKIVKWLFIIFNLLMIAWLVSAIVNVSELPSPQNEYEEAGAGIGLVLGFGMIFVIWAIGDIIIGIVVLLTRRRKTIEWEE